MMKLFDCPQCTDEFLAVTDGRTDDIFLWVQAINSVAISRGISSDELLAKMHQPHIDKQRGRMVR